MNKRFAAVAAVSAMAATSMIAVVAPSSASAATASLCGQAKWDTHPDKMTGGGYQFGNGAAIRTAGYTDCTTLGLGYASHGIDVHCMRTNDNGMDWMYVRDTTTGVSGWVRFDALYTSQWVYPERCG